MWAMAANRKVETLLSVCASVQLLYIWSVHNGDHDGWSNQNTCTPFLCDFWRAWRNFPLPWVYNNISIESLLLTLTSWKWIWSDCMLLLTAANWFLVDTDEIQYSAHTVPCLLHLSWIWKLYLQFALLLWMLELLDCSWWRDSVKPPL